MVKVSSERKEGFVGRGLRRRCPPAKGEGGEVPGSFGKIRIFLLQKKERETRDGGKKALWNFSKSIEKKEGGEIGSS